ncbi:type IV pilus major pilin [Enterobacillus tribolii]|uniref:Toxin co-regulated pilin n=1 Tax=Enterobacillus tribolii TaxID=1487935 RepID=A0A370QRK9_9GAMM|nr:type IV pilus major pilin [Enterobacillus tribolii]MBW7983609.1 type IV pilus major pilin [Enterobacillus tribolii]RDK91892.1 toxin co-regulated pilin [Enterobacillus tribolii]
MDALFVRAGKRLDSKVKKLRELRNQRGVTLLEIIIVLGIIGVIAAGVVLLAQRAFVNQDISDVINNTNSIRTAAIEAYKDQGAYPSSSNSAVGLTKATIKTATNDSIIATLVKMGKISADEAFNGFSSDAFQMGPARTSGNSTVNKGFVLVVNGLDTETCRNLVSQMGPQWDYVATTTAAAGADANIDDMDLTGAVNITNGLLKTLDADSLNPTNIVNNGVCNQSGSTNAAIFGSR